MTPTTIFASWPQIEPMSASPADSITDALGEYGCDYDGEALLSAWIAAINEKLPAGLQLHLNGEVSGPVGFDGDPAQLVRDAIEDANLPGLMEEHDITPRAATLVLYKVTGDGQRGEPIDHTAIEGNEHAHEVLRDLADDVDAADLDDAGVEVGDQLDYVVVDFQNNELRAARVTAR